MGLFSLPGRPPLFLFPHPQFPSATGHMLSSLTFEFHRKRRKGTFQDKLEAAKGILFSNSQVHHDTLSFLNAMLDHVLTAPACSRLLYSSLEQAGAVLSRLCMATGI